MLQPPSLRSRPTAPLHATHGGRAGAEPGRDQAGGGGASLALPHRSTMLWGEGWLQANPMACRSGAGNPRHGADAGPAPCPRPSAVPWGWVMACPRPTSPEGEGPGGNHHCDLTHCQDSPAPSQTPKSRKRLAVAAWVQARFQDKYRCCGSWMSPQGKAHPLPGPVMVLAHLCHILCGLQQV